MCTRRPSRSSRNRRSRRMAAREKTMTAAVNIKMRMRDCGGKSAADQSRRRRVSGPRSEVSFPQTGRDFSTSPVLFDFPPRPPLQNRPPTQRPDLLVDYISALQEHLDLFIPGLSLMRTLPCPFTCLELLTSKTLLCHKSTTRRPTIQIQSRRGKNGLC